MAPRDRPLTVVHVVRQFAPGVGGIEAVVESLAREQVKAGHRVRVVTLDRLFHSPEAALPGHEELSGIEVRRISYIGSKRYPIAPAALKFITDADIVHVHAIDFFFDYLAATRILHGKKLVVSTHGGFFHTEFAAALKKLYFATITRASLAGYDAVAASSVQDEHAFQRLSSRVELIENGVDIRKFSGLAAKQACPALLYFGRVAPNKNIESLFPFLRALRDRGAAAWRLVIAGTSQGVTFDALRSAAITSGVADAVAFVESPSDDDLRRLIGQSSVFVSASKYEGFGIAPIEALSAGLLPVISDIPPHRRTIEAAGEGLLVRFQEPEKAAADMAAAWEAWVARGAAGPASAMYSVERYDWRAVSGRFEDVYRRVLR